MVKIGTFWVISIFKEYSHHLVFAEFMNYSVADLRPSRLKTFYKYDDRVNLWIDEGVNLDLSDASISH